MKKNVCLLSLILLFASHLSIYGNVVTADSDSIRMRQVFAEMPDSILGILTKYNRLDCIDFIENNLPAKVENRLGGRLVTIVIEGSIEDVQAAIEVGYKAGDSITKCVAHAVIPRPHEEVIALLEKSSLKFNKARG